MYNSPAPASPSLPPQRRLSIRRGSVSAPDPLGKRTQLNDAVHSSSTLTIVRVTSSSVSPQPSPNEPSSPRRLHRRLSSNATQTPASASAEGGRLSFALSSFSGPSTPGGGRPSSPPARPSSPHRSVALPGPKPRLSPEQLYELAKSSTDPRIIQQQIQQQQHSRPSSPSQSPQFRAHSPLGHPPSASFAPAVFTPLPDDVLLPFLDRPAEVKALISTPPSAKLFTLLSQTFLNKQLERKEQAGPPLKDPAQWSYSQLYDHLTTVPREQEPDVLWVIKARRCILSHSELIWERVKGALGVPPEADLEWDPAFAEQGERRRSFDSDVSQGNLSRDTGDWNAVVDSPLLERRAFPSTSREGTEAEPPSRFGIEVDHRLRDIAQGDQVPRRSDLQVGQSPEDTGASATPVGTKSPLRSAGTCSPVSPASHVNIETLVAPPSGAFSPGSIMISNPPPLSLSGVVTDGSTGGLGLGDIEEGTEEEDEAVLSSGAQRAEDKRAEAAKEEEPEPNQIHGLKISTGPISMSSPRAQASAFAAPSFSGADEQVYVPMSPISPLPPYHYSPDVHGHQPGLMQNVGPFRPSNSAASSYNAGSVLERQMENVGIRDENDLAYNPVGDRAPGNPLFPSNFARLAVGPTLVANNPALRSPPMPPAPRYGSNLNAAFYQSLRQGHAHKQRTLSHSAAFESSAIQSSEETRRQSWGMFRNANRATGPDSDYAITIDSGSSVGE